MSNTVEIPKIKPAKKKKSPPLVQPPTPEDARNRELSRAEIIAGIKSRWPKMTPNDQTTAIKVFGTELTDVATAKIIIKPEED